jgi:hypothetical protein
LHSTKETTRKHKMFDDYIVEGDCFGSRFIDFDGNSEQGLVTVNYHDQSSLRLLVIGGHSNYQGQLVLADTKVRFENDDNTKLRTIVGYFLGHDDSVASTYRPIEAHQLMVMLRQRRDNGIVKMLWSGRLCKISNALSSLCFTLNQQHEKLDQARSDQEKLKASVQEWRETAELIQHKLQIEKDILTHQFSQLFKTIQVKFLTMKMDLERLQREQQIVQDPATVTMKPQKAERMKSVEGFTEGQSGDHKVFRESSFISQMAECSKSKIEVISSERLVGKARLIMPENEKSRSVAIEKSSPKTEKKSTETPKKPSLDSRMGIAMMQNERVDPSVKQQSASYISSIPSTNRLLDAKVLCDPEDLFLDSAISESLSQTKSRNLKRGRENRQEPKKLFSKPVNRTKVSLSLSEARALLDDSDDDGGW